MTAVEMILAAAEQHAGRVAIEDAAGRGVTYRELIARARQAAAGVGASGASGKIIELEAARSVDFVVACLGAWLAGAAWTPIDPAEPTSRVAAIRGRLARELEARRSLSGAERELEIGRSSSSAVVEHEFGRSSSSEVRELEAGYPSSSAVRGSAGVPAAARLAYVIPTSGSSGTPKLVMVSHRGLPALLHAQIAAFALEPGARALWLHAPVFDASVSDWGTALASGATLVIPSPRALATPSALRVELVERAISHVDLPPVLLPYLEPPPPGLRVVVLGGEPCDVGRVRALARHARVVVVYGPTEATVCSSLVVVDPERWTRPLIGAPLPGVRYRVIDGELWIGGDGLAAGYAGDPDETARCFVVRDGERLYRTGDRVEPCDGGLAFIGRVDRQHKLAGRRVELGEIEAVIRRAPGVRDAAVCVRSIGHGPSRAIAFVDGDVDPVAIRAFVRAEAPAWMVPARVVVGALPRTATGKIDHAALAARELPSPGQGRSGLAVDRGAPARTPADALEAELAAAWCDALGIDEPTGERFRDAGGDSLSTLVLHAAAAARGIAIEPDLLATDPTFDELLARVRDGDRLARMTVAECERRGLAASVELLARDARRDDPGNQHPASSPRLALRAPIRGNPRPGGRRRERVLMTGATGFLGAHLLRAWRARDTRPIVALVRAPDEAVAPCRLGSIDGVDVVCGDVARPRLGLSVDAWSELAAGVTAVVHGAAAMRLAGGWDDHAGTNVAGTAEIARLVATSPDIAWHHVSTLSVFVGTDRRIGSHREDATPDPEAVGHGGYAQTKIAAEAIARAARGRDAATTILRLGLLVGDPPRPGDQLAMTLRGLARLGAIPDGAGELRLDLTPVEHAAAAVAALALRAERAGTAAGSLGSSHAGAPAGLLGSAHAALDEIHHIASARGATFGELTAALRDAGAGLVALPPDAWADRARAQLADPEIAMAYLALGQVHAADRLAPYDLFLATGASFCTERTAALLDELAIAPPQIDLTRLVAGALRAEAGP